MAGFINLLNILVDNRNPERLLKPGRQSSFAVKKSVPSVIIFW